MDTSTAWSTTQGGVSLTLLLSSSRYDDDDKKAQTLFISSFFFSSSDPPHKPTDDTTAEEFRDLLNLNLISYFVASKVMSPTRVKLLKKTND